MHAQLNVGPRHSGQGLLASMHELHMHFGSPARATRSVADTCNARARGAQASGLGHATPLADKYTYVAIYACIHVDTDIYIFLGAPTRYALEF